MTYHEIKAKSLIRRYRKIDSWFISKYGMNLYRGCEHNCVYCDGRNEKYQVNGVFGKEVAVKINAIELLKKETTLRRRQKFYSNGFIMVGGGVGDSYQPAEERYQLTRQTLTHLDSLRLPVHLLSKSTLVERDIDLLKQINENSKAVISFSFSSTNDEISQIFEPGVPLPSKRLQTIKNLKKQGFHCGMFLLPVIPFITDTAEIMKKTIEDANKAGVDFIIFGGLTLKKGRQKDFFYDVLKQNYPDLLPSYEMVYTDNKWGNASKQYYQSINHAFQSIMKHYSIPKRIPPKIFNDVVNSTDKVIIMLDHIDYLLKLQNRRSPYGYAAYNISRSKQDITTMKHDLQHIKGVGKVTEKIILEILETGTSTYYEKLLTR
jgi:DNA repair photolyase